MTDSRLQLALAGLPHGPEFRFVDRLLSLDPGVRGRGEYHVHGNEPFLRGHFPGEPLLPGVLLVEAAAQLAGVVAQSDPAQARPQLLKLTALRSIKILGSARPGETVVLDAQLTGRLGGLVQARVTAHVNATLVLEGDLVLTDSAAGQPLTNPAHVGTNIVERPPP
jgi:3-hydroxyacyl-[acyl-carrier-protein] dehydratase